MDSKKKVYGLLKMMLLKLFKLALNYIYKKTLKMVYDGLEKF